MNHYISSTTEKLTSLQLTISQSGQESGLYSLTPSLPPAMNLTEESLQSIPVMMDCPDPVLISEEPFSSVHILTGENPVSVIAAQAPPPTRGKTRGRPRGKKQAESSRGRGRGRPRGRPSGRGNERGNGRGLRRGQGQVHSLTHSPEIVTAGPPSLPHSPAEIDNTYVRR